MAAMYDNLTKSWQISCGNHNETLFLSELTENEVVKKYNIDNNPTTDHFNSLNDLINNVYQPLCQYYGIKIPVLFSYVSETLNTYYNIPTSSEHLSGIAIDLDISALKRNVSNRDLFYYSKDNIQYNNLIWEYGNDNNPQYIHISYIQGNNSGNILYLRSLGQKMEQYSLTPTTFNGLGSL